MPLSKRLIMSLVFSCFFEACSPKPATVERAADAPPPSKPKFDFGNTAVSPASGKGREAVFRVVTSGGSQKPALLGLLINDKQNGGDACYVIKNLTNNDSMLVLDAGAGTVLMGNKNSIRNHQCELLREGTGSSEEPSGITVTFHIRFLPGFRGVRHIWAVPEDAQGYGPDMKLVGDWTVE